LALAPLAGTGSISSLPWTSHPSSNNERVLVASVITSSSGLDGHNQNTGSTQVTQLGIVDTILFFLLSVIFLLQRLKLIFDTTVYYLCATTRKCSFGCIIPKHFYVLICSYLSDSVGNNQEFDVFVVALMVTLQALLQSYFPIIV
jgi:hypothetical protein